MNNHVLDQVHAFKAMGLSPIHAYKKMRELGFLANVILPAIAREYALQGDELKGVYLTGEGISIERHQAEIAKIINDIRPGL